MMSLIIDLPRLGDFALCAQFLLKVLSIKIHKIHILFYAYLPTGLLGNRRRLPLRRPGQAL